MADPSFLGSLQGHAAEAKRRAEVDKAQRLREGARRDGVILSQRDILTGNWDAMKTLQTTLGGAVRSITTDDLVKFKRNINVVQERYSKGITAKQIVDWSTKKAHGCKDSDLDKARREIHMAVPASAFKGVVRFITNAGPDSMDTRHHVTIEFMNYGAESASGARDARKSALRLRHGPLKIECDCGKWRFWYRYIATIAGFNAGRGETGFPKIRNPNLTNVACKHIVKVAAEIQNGTSVLTFLTRLMDKAKSSDEAKAAIRMAQKEAEKIIKNQNKRTTGHDIKTSAQKRAEQSRKNAAAVLKAATKPVKVKPASKRELQLKESAARWKSLGVPRDTVAALFASGDIKVPKGTTSEQFLRYYDEG